MLEDSTDVPARNIRQPCITLFVVEERFPVRPQRLVGVHSRAVVVVERLGHERSDLAVKVGFVLDDVLELQDVVGGLDHRVETVVDLALTGCSDLVVRTLDFEARRCELKANLVTKVRELVHGADGEVATLVGRLVGEVSAFFFATRVPRGLFGVDLVERCSGRHLVADVIEDKEFGFGCEERGVRNPCRSEVLLGLLRNLAGVTVVNLAVARVVDVKNQDERLLDSIRVKVGSGHIGDELQVALGDSLETGDGRAVKQLTDTEELFVNGARRNVEVLLDAGKIGETDVKELDVLGGDVFQYLGGCGEHGDSCGSDVTTWLRPRYRCRVSQPSHECFGDVTKCRVSD